jgi:hypothetical protein
MKKKLTIGLAAIAVASTALGICWVAGHPDCPGIPGKCPDGESGTDVQCNSEDKKDTNSETGTGFYLTNTSGICTYNCTYQTYQGRTNRTYCGTQTNNWNGYKPNDVLCPSGS